MGRRSMSNDVIPPELSMAPMFPYQWTAYHRLTGREDVTIPIHPSKAFGHSFSNFSPSFIGGKGMVCMVQ
jgi:hypothetical protein